MRRDSTKVRAKRIALHYFKRPHPFRRWKTALSVAVPLLALGWLATHAARGDQRLYTSGPVATAHALFGSDCAACHVPAGGSGRAVEAGGPEAGRATGAAHGNSFFLKVSDRACTACHDGPLHHENQAFVPACVSCHVEHKGRIELARLADRYCTQCHAELQTRGRTAVRFDGRITSFATGHPEFAINVAAGNETRRVRLDRRSELKDTAQVKLNHQKHLKVGLQGVEDAKMQSGMTGLLERKDGLQLNCSFCHRTDETRASMQPVSFAQHCAVCHPLDFDARFAGAVVPHDRPPIVHAYLRTLFVEAFEQCQALSSTVAGDDAAAKARKQCQDLELIAAPPADRPRGGRSRGGESAESPAATPGSAEPTPADSPRGARVRGGASAEAKAEEPADQPRGGRRTRSEPAEDSASDQPRGRRGRGETTTAPPAPTRGGSSALDWAAGQLTGAERLIFKQKCELCHTLTFAADAPPSVAPTAVPVRWFPYSRFDHGVHRPLACTECHNATTSQETSDVLLPSVAVCRACHRDAGGARASCVECHQYHDKAKDRDLNGPFPVKALAPPP